ncbi:MAG TPA: hypothetical protein VK737_07980, partial [Opitutales bacterium]|nr:hypothetical protein [Opitutales bacterium]
WGAYLLLGSAWMYQMPDTTHVNDPAVVRGISVGLAGLALLFLFKEWQQRQNRYAICLRGPRLGIYRGQKFEVEITRPQLTVYNTRFANTLRLIIPLLACMFFGVMPFLPQHTDPNDLTVTIIPETLMDKIAGVGLVLASVSSLVSVIFTRHFWTIFWLPRKKWLRPTFCTTYADGVRLLNAKPQ